MLTRQFLSEREWVNMFHVCMRKRVSACIMWTGGPSQCLCVCVCACVGFKHEDQEGGKNVEGKTADEQKKINVPLSNSPKRKWFDLSVFVLLFSNIRRKRTTGERKLQTKLCLSSTIATVLGQQTGETRRIGRKLLSISCFFLFIFISPGWNRRLVIVLLFSSIATLQTENYGRLQKYTWW